MACFVDVQNAVEMVELVANCAGKKALGFQDVLFAVAVLIGNGDLHRTGNDTALSTNGKAAFPAVLFPFLQNNGRVDKFKIPFFHVHDGKAA